MQLYCRNSFSKFKRTGFTWKIHIAYYKSKSTSGTIALLELCSPKTVHLSCHHLFSPQVHCNNKEVLCLARGRPMQLSQPMEVPYKSPWNPMQSSMEVRYKYPGKSDACTRMLEVFMKADINLHKYPIQTSMEVRDKSPWRSNTKFHGKSNTNLHGSLMQIWIQSLGNFPFPWLPLTIWNIPKCSALRIYGCFYSTVKMETKTQKRGNTSSTNLLSPASYVGHHTRLNFIWAHN